MQSHARQQQQQQQNDDVVVRSNQTTPIADSNTQAISQSNRRLRKQQYHGQIQMNITTTTKESNIVRKNDR